MWVRGESVHLGGPDAPVRIEVITYAPTVFYHCQHCELTWQQIGVGDRLHRREAREALPDDLLEEWHRLSEWVDGLIRTYGSRVSVKVVDAASIEGVWKSVRHRVRTYPTVIVGGQEKRTGADFASIGPLIKELLAVGDGPTEHQTSGGR
jgi:hypothetical protein